MTTASLHCDRGGVVALVAFEHKAGSGGLQVDAVGSAVAVGSQDGSWFRRPLRSGVDATQHERHRWNEHSLCFGRRANPGRETGAFRVSDGPDPVYREACNPITHCSEPCSPPPRRWSLVRLLGHSGLRWPPSVDLEQTPSWTGHLRR